MTTPNRKNTDALWAIYDLLEERLPKDGICGDEHTTTWSQPLLGIKNETSVHVCVLTAGHGGLHRNENGSAQWGNAAVAAEPNDLDSLIASAHPEVRRHIEAVQKSVRVLLKSQNADQAVIVRLTRERDDARREREMAESEGLAETRALGDASQRVLALAGERDKALKELEQVTKHASGWRRLHQELRADVVKHSLHHAGGSMSRECFDGIIIRDDNRDASDG